MATLEEYYVGELMLPVCNGVSDGSVALIATYIITAIFGWEIWTIKVMSGTWLHIEGVEELGIGHIVLLLLAVMQILSWFTYGYGILSAPYPNRDQNGVIMKVTEPVNCCTFFTQMFAHFLFGYLWFQLAFIGNDPIIGGQPITLTHEKGESGVEPPYRHAGEGYFMAHLLILCFMVCH